MLHLVCHYIPFKNILVANIYTLKLQLYPPRYATVNKNEFDGLLRCFGSAYFLPEEWHMLDFTMLPISLAFVHKTLEAEWEDFLLVSLLTNGAKLLEV